MENLPANMTDHDLLITLHEQIKNVRTDIKDLKDGTGSKLTDHEARIRVLETNQIDKKDFDKLQKIAYGGLGILAAIEFAFKFFYH